MSDNKSGIVKSIFERGDKPDSSRISALLKSGKGVKGVIANAKPVGAPRPKNVKVYPYGIDIGRSAVKFAQLGKTKQNTIIINNVGIAEFSKEAIIDPAKRQTELPFILAKIVEENRISGDVYVSFPAEEAKTRVVNIPVMPESEVRNAIGWALRQEFHINLEEHSFDYIPVERLDKDKKGFNAYFAIAIKKQSIFTVLAIFEKLGLRVKAVDLDLIAEISALELAGFLKKDDSVSLVVDVGRNSASFSVFYKEAVYFLRALSAGGKTFTNSLEKSLGVSFDEAERIKIDSPEDLTVPKAEMPAPMPVVEQETENPIPQAENGENLVPQAENQTSEIQELPAPVPERSPDEIRNTAISDTLDVLAQGIDQHFKFFSFQISRSSVTTFDKIILVGGGALLKSMPRYIKERFGVEVETPNLLESMELSQGVSAKFDKEYINKMAPRLLAAIGLAERGLE